MTATSFKPRQRGMMEKHVAREQVYRNIESGEVSQIRQEMSDGSIEWWYDGKAHQESRPTAADVEAEEAEELKNEKR